MPFIELTQQIKVIDSTVVDDAMSETSTNPVQNRVITDALADKADDDRVDELESKLQWIELE